MSSRRSNRDLNNADYQRLARFRFALRKFLHFSEDAAREAGLSPQQYQALVAIRGFDGSKPATVGDLSKRLLIEHHSAVGLVDRLVEAGLLVRQREEADNRRVALLLTDKAETLLSSLTLSHRDELRRLLPLMKPLFMQLESGKSAKT